MSNPETFAASSHVCSQQTNKVTSNNETEFLNLLFSSNKID